MSDKPSETESELRQGEVAVALPPQSDAGLNFIGTIHALWHTARNMQKRGSLDGPIGSIPVDERWQVGLTDLAGDRRIQVLYWMHRARRDGDLVLQTPFSTIDGTTLQVRGLDCLDGTPLIDLKRERGAVSG